MFADVAIPVPLHHTFTYRIPGALQAAIRPGIRVVVPFHRRQAIGIVIHTGAPPPPHTECKEIIDVCEAFPVLSLPLLRLCHWISRYYASPIGEVCRTALPAPFFRRAKLPQASRLAPAHHGGTDFANQTPITLTAAQQHTRQTVATAITAARFQTFLLHGITGSGKTEVYLSLIADTLARQRQALLLLPEIGLTPQLLDRLSARFGEAVALYHSGLTDAQRVEQWWRLAQGEAQICCGTRSAVFAPLDRLGCIILDEEHDASYKQEDSPHYHGRDIAIVRAQMDNAVAVLGSATPSLESFHNVRAGKYHYLALKERPSGAVLPQITLIDMRREPASNDASGLLSRPLRAAILETLARREQVLIYLNRRGFAHLILCSDCGHVFRCPNCEISLTLHRQANTLQCHYCEFTIARPSACAGCQGAHLRAVGSGTERIEAALAKHFPEARLARLDRDTSTGRTARQDLLRTMRKGEIDILVGTQMITKGHDFPSVTLVGVVAADLSLHLPDFRAAERTFQLLTQVAGRAGRADRPGQVLIQTYTPEHYSLLCAQQHNFAGFMEAEIQQRQALRYPPFGRLINIRISSNIESRVADYAAQLRRDLEPQCQRTGIAVQILGPAPAPRSKMAGRHRWQLLLKTGDGKQFPSITQMIQQHASTFAPRGVHVAIDVDPLHLM